ncbi:MAG: ATP-binding protein [Clostridiales bacterium]|nr:ATP-binding protein [Clostridiales bacterium]
MRKILLPKRWFMHIKTGNRRRDTENSSMILISCTLVGLLFYVLGLSEANIITIYILGILLISSLTSARIYGIVSSVLGVLLFNCLFAEPRFTLFVFDLQYTLTAIIMLVSSLVISSVMTVFREQLDKEILETRRSELLLKISQGLRQTKCDREMLDVVTRELQTLSRHNIALIPVKEGEPGQPIGMEEEGGDTEWLTEAQRKKLREWLAMREITDRPFVSVGAGQKNLLYPVQSGKTVFALIFVSLPEKEDLPRSLQSLLPPLLDAIALTLEKERLRAASERAAQEAETERLRANLLRTVSHDLRTPLTGIAGAADILLNSEGQITPNMRRQMYQSIYDDAEWLKNMVENLLFVTRLENSSMSIRLQPELLQEILPEALRHINRRGKNQILELSLPEELLMVKAEPNLLMQVVINIVDNAVKYAPVYSNIAIIAMARDGKAVVEVADTGPGIKEADKARVFEMFYAAGNSDIGGRQGVGLGLALCQSIIKAHGGEIYVQDNLPAGTVIGFSLDLEGLY